MLFLIRGGRSWDLRLRLRMDGLMTVCDVVVVVGDEGDASMIRRSFIAL